MQFWHLGYGKCAMSGMQRASSKGSVCSMLKSPSLRLLISNPYLLHLRCNFFPHSSAVCVQFGFDRCPQIVHRVRGLLAKNRSLCNVRHGRTVPLRGGGNEGAHAVQAPAAVVSQAALDSARRSGLTYGAFHAGQSANKRSAHAEFRSL